MRIESMSVCCVFLISLIPSVAMGYGFSITCAQYPAMQMDDFRITVHNSAAYAIAPECEEPWDSDWTCSVVDEGSGVSTVEFNGATPLSTSFAHNFKILDNITPGSFMTHRATWIGGGTPYPVSLPVVEFEANVAGDEVTVKIRNDYSVNINIWEVHYKTMSNPYPIEDLDLGTSSMTWVPEFQNYSLEIAEEISFSIVMHPYQDEVLVRVHSAFSDTPTINSYNHTQMGVSEMQTSTAVETWSGVKTRYE